MTSLKLKSVAKFNELQTRPVSTSTPITLKFGDSSSSCFGKEDNLFLLHMYLSGVDRVPNEEENEHKPIMVVGRREQGRIHGHPSRVRVGRGRF